MFSLKLFEVSKFKADESNMNKDCSIWVSSFLHLIDKRLSSYWTSGKISLEKAEVILKFFLQFTMLSQRISTNSSLSLR